jgi:hypothetical protein
VRGAVVLGAAAIAVIAVGLLILLTRPAAPSAGTSPTPSALATLSRAPVPTIVITPATSAPTSLPPRLTTPPSASP